MTSNRIKGLIFGQAIGDALGLSTEFLSKRDVSLVYKDAIFTYDNILQDEHRKIWNKGEWTDDTDMCIVLLKHLLSSKDFHIDEKILAKDFKNWYLNGLKIDENYTKPACGIGRNIGRVLNHPQFLNNPKLSSLIISLNCPSNGAIMRSSFLSLFPNHISNTINSCKITHYSEDSIVSCLFIVMLLKKILKNDDIDCAINEVVLLIEELNYDTDELKKYINFKSLDELKLNEHIGYTYKPLGCAIYALKNHNNSFYGVLESIIKEGGDADTNCCVAGAILGAYLGYDKIESNLVDGLCNKIYLDKLYLLYNKTIMEKTEPVVPEYGWNSKSKLIIPLEEVSKHLRHIIKEDMVDSVYEYTKDSRKIREQPEKMKQLNQLILDAPVLEKEYTVYHMSGPESRISVYQDEKNIYVDDVQENLKEDDIFMKYVGYKDTSIISATYDKSYPLSGFSRDLATLTSDDIDVEHLSETINFMSFWQIKKYIKQNKTLSKVYTNIFTEIKKDENLITILKKEYNYKTRDFTMQDLYSESKVTKNEQIKSLVKEMKQILIDMYYTDICCCCLFKIKIRNKKGLLIGKASKYPDQYEILLPNSTLFHVNKVYRTNYGVAIRPLAKYISEETIKIKNKEYQRFNKLPNEMDYVIKNITVYEIETIN